MTCDNYHTLITYVVHYLICAECKLTSTLSRESHGSQFGITIQIEGLYNRFLCHSHSRDDASNIANVSQQAQNWSRMGQNVWMPYNLETRLCHGMEKLSVSLALLGNLLVTDGFPSQKVSDGLSFYIGVTHVPRCIPGSLTSGFRNVTYLVRGPCHDIIWCRNHSSASKWSASFIEFREQSYTIISLNLAQNLTVDLQRNRCHDFYNIIAAFLYPFETTFIGTVMSGWIDHPILFYVN